MSIGFSIFISYFNSFFYLLYSVLKNQQFMDSPGGLVFHAIMPPAADPGLFPGGVAWRAGGGLVADMPGGGSQAGGAAGL